MTHPPAISRRAGMALGLGLVGFGGAFLKYHA